MSEPEDKTGNSGDYSEASAAPEGESSPLDNARSEKFLIFSIMNKFYCFSSRLIGEIAVYDAVYPLPLMPPYILGVVNRYSIPYALFDIGILFHKTPSPRKKLLVFKDEIDRIAVLIDDVSGIADIDTDEIITVEKNIDSGELTEAVSASFYWNGKDVFVLDINRIIERVSREIE